MVAPGFGEIPLDLCREASLSHQLVEASG